MSKKDSWAEALFQGFLWVIAILFTTGMLYSFGQLSEKEKRDIIIIIMMMGNNQ